MKRGAMDYLPKPFTPEEITRAVRKARARKREREKKAFGRFDRIIEKFPVPSLDDKGPKIIAETVAQTIGVAKANSPWLPLFVLGILGGAYIGFGGLFFTSVTFDLSTACLLACKR
jgi:formate transporter